MISIPSLFFMSLEKLDFNTLEPRQREELSRAVILPALRFSTPDYEKGLKKHFSAKAISSHLSSELWEKPDSYEKLHEVFADLFQKFYADHGIASSNIPETVDFNFEKRSGQIQDEILVQFFSHVARQSESASEFIQKLNQDPELDLSQKAALMRNWMQEGIEGHFQFPMNDSLKYAISFPKEVLSLVGLSDDQVSLILEKAADCGHFETIEAICQNKLRFAYLPPQAVPIALMNAARKGHFACLKILLEKAQDKIPGFCIDKAIAIAQENNHTECVSLIASLHPGAVLEK